MKKLLLLLFLTLTATAEFHTGVWLQDPGDAPKWKSFGVNRFVGIWKGPTQAEINTLRAAGMKVYAEPTEAALADTTGTVVGLLQIDEPDNSQPTTDGWGPPMPTAEIQRRYAEMKSKSQLPVFLNLSQGIAWPEKYWFGQWPTPDVDVVFPGYLAGCDVVAFDIYPMSNVGNYYGKIQHEAWRVALGVDRLKQYAPGKPVQAFIETGDIMNTGYKPTPEQMRSMVWMAVVHGATGINYFIHGKSPNGNFDSRAVFHYPEMMSAISKVNNELQSFTPVTNMVSDYIVDWAKTPTGIVAVGMGSNIVTRSFPWSDRTAEVVGEGRTLTATAGVITDTFKYFEAHIYRAPSRIAPDPPSDLAFNGRVLSWKDNSNNELSFTVERCLNTRWIKAGSTAENGSLWEDTSTLKDNREYKYRVWSENSAGRACSPEVTLVTAQRPATPTQLRKKAVLVQLTWRDNAVDEDWYEIHRKTAAGWQWYTNAWRDGTSTLVPEGSYRVRAVTSKGYGYWSGEVK